MSPPGANKTFADALRTPLIPRLAGLLAAGMGALVLIAWHAHWTRVIQLLPGLPLMHYNTALCFILCGAGLFLLTTSRAGAVPWLGAVAGLVGTLTLLQYITGRDFGIDQFFLKPYFDVATQTGRMAPPSAFSFVLLGIELALTGSKVQRPAGLAGAGLLASVALAITVVTLAGYVFQIESPYGWGAYLRMALNSAVAFTLLSIGLLVHEWRVADRKNDSFLRRLPVTGAVTVMLMIGFISVVNMAQLRSAIAWRKNTYQVVESAQTFQSDYIAMQRNLRGYVTMGTPELLTAFQQDTNTWPIQLNHLIELTHADPAQLPQLRAISDAVLGVIAYDNQQIALYQRSGAQAVFQMDTTGKGRVFTGRVLDGINAFTVAEKALLNQGDVKEESDYECLENLLIFGSILSAVLLVLAHTMASRELKFRRRAEAELQKTFALQTAILSSANYAVISVSPEGLVTSFNPTAERWLGYAAAEVIGAKTPELWHDPREIKTRAQVVSAELGRLIEPGFGALVAKARLGQPDNFESVFMRKDGSRFPVSLSISALKDRAGTIAGFVGVIADLTERKKSEEKLRESEDRFRLIVETVSDYAIFMLDTEGRVASWNSGAERIKGYKAAEVIGGHFSRFFPPKAVEAGKPDWLLHEALSQGRVQDDGWRVRKDGSWFFADVVITVLRDAGGQHRGFVEVVHDITERRKAEERLRVSEERFRRSFEDGPIGLALVSMEGHWMRVNNMMCQIVGYSESELLATSFQAITHPDDLQADLDQVGQLLAGKINSYQMEKRYFHKRGNIVNVLLSVSLVRDAESKPLYFVSQVQDITERKKAELKLAEQTEQLKRSNHELEQFAYVASHDMQEPLRAISGFSQILKQQCADKLDDHSKQFIGQIIDGAKRMANLIDDLLTLSRVGSQGKPFVLTGIEKPLRQAERNLMVMIQERNAVIRQGDLPALPVDASQLTLLFQNLIANGIKFCRDRAPEIYVGAERAGEGFWKISVRDNGIGIEPKYFDRIFGIFQRLHTRDEYPGTGIGLAVCKKIVERHGGVITLESEPGKGTTFHFTLPEKHPEKHE